MLQKGYEKWHPGISAPLFTINSIIILDIIADLRYSRGKSASPPLNFELATHSQFRCWESMVLFHHPLEAVHAKLLSR